MWKFQVGIINIILNNSILMGHCMNVYMEDFYCDYQNEMYEVKTFLFIIVIVS